MRIQFYLILLLMIFSCQEKTVKETKTVELSVESQENELVLNDTIVYLSNSNDLALIKLTLIPDGTFDFYMSIYPEPMQNSEPISNIIKSKGTWSGNDKTLLLVFADREKDTLNLNDLFDSKFKRGNEFKVINQNTVEIDYTLDELNIWGISCTKTGANNA